MTAELGVGPAAYARARRAQSARIMLDATDLPITEIAYAAGFSRIRQFNETMLSVFGCSPGELRRKRVPARLACHGELLLRLDYRPPLAADELLSFLAGHAVPGVEDCDADSYRRTLRLPRGPALVELTPLHDAHRIAVRLRLVDRRHLPAAVQACRRMLDLVADPMAVADTLRRDPLLAPLVTQAPGLRVPGAADGFELAVRAIIGQQVCPCRAPGH